MKNSDFLGECGGDHAKNKQSCLDHACPTRSLKVKERLSKTEENQKLTGFAGVARICKQEMIC